MWMKLLTIGAVSSLLTGAIIGCVSDEPREIQFEYINLTDKTILIQSFRMFEPIPGYEEQEPFLIQRNDSIDVYGTLQTSNFIQYNADSVFVIFNNQRILKWYPDSTEIPFSFYNLDNYEHPNDANMRCIYRFTEAHWKHAEEMK